jgi:signal transduction histidine kinase
MSESAQPIDALVDPLQAIPSPTLRLGIGLCVILSAFVIFAVYATRQLRWLEDFQSNVVARNRRASLQLLRLQNDAYLLAISLHDLALASGAYPIRDSQPEFTRLESDVQDALAREGKVAVSTPLSDEKRARLGIALQQFRASADQVFSLAASGDDARVRQAARAEMEPRRVEISEEVAELLRLNDQAQVEAAQRISAIYSGVKTDVLFLTALLFLLALGTGLYTFRANRRTFERLQHLTEQLRMQSGQLRKLSWKLIDVQEDTLRQVSRDLHDEFGQILTGIGLMLRRAGQRAAADPTLLQQLEEVKHVAEETLQRIREQSQMFRPAVLDDFGLEQTLEWLAGVFEKQSGLPVSFRWDGAESELPPEASIHVYRVVQEALNNTARHSRASQAWVSVERGKGQLQVEVRDDGAGFDPEASPGEGLGLMGMRERAQHLRGVLNIESHPAPPGQPADTGGPGQGTTVRLTVPLERLPQAPLRPSAEKVV